MQGQADLLVGLFLPGIQRKFLAKLLLGNALKSKDAQILCDIGQPPL